MQAKAHVALRLAGATVLCAALAALLSLPLQHSDLELRAKLPLVFLIVVILVARKMGEAAAILGTIAAALVFAMLLFQPLGSLGVTTKAARMSLAWFLLGGMVCAHLLSPPSGKTRRRSSDFSHHGPDAE
jgi:K+-sensing histidine kinase KdpD